MRRKWDILFGNLTLIPLLGLGLLAGVARVEAAPPTSVLTEPAEKSCGSFGTQIDFLESPTEAAKQAKKEGKLVFVLHVSGNFEDPNFT